MAHASYFTQLTPLETQALFGIYKTQASLVAPLISTHSLGLHDFAPVVVPTGKSYTHGIPSYPVVQAASLR